MMRTDLSLSRKSRSLAVLVAFVVALALTSNPTRAVPGEIAVNIEVNPATVPPGGSVNVSGSGFFPTSSVEIYFRQDGVADVQIGTATAGSDGAFSATVTIPGDAAPGTATIVATAGSQAAQADILVEDSEPIGDGDDDDDDDELCQIRVTLVRITRKDPVSQPLLAQTKVVTFVNLGIGGSELTRLVGDLAPVDVDHLVGDSLWPKKKFPRVLSVGSQIKADANGAGRNAVRINCPDSQSLTVSVRIQVVEPMDLTTFTRPVRTVVYELEYKVEVAEVQ